MHNLLPPACSTNKEGTPCWDEPDGFSTKSIFLSIPILSATTPRPAPSDACQPSHFTRVAGSFGQLDDTSNMAVISSIPGLEATVLVNGVAAVEYQDPDAEESHTMAREQFDLPQPYDQALPHVVRYIEAKPGAPYLFQVAKKYHIRGQNHHVAYSVSVDGQKFGPCHQPAHTRRDRKGQWTSTLDSYISGNPTAGYQRHSFQFAALDIGTAWLFSNDVASTC
jgi:hypothetical protein